MRNIKITVEYDGADYKGWQKQPRARTVQGEIENALFRITGEKPVVYGSGRTDAGVHALGQAANFFIWARLVTDKLRKALNAELPDDVTVKSAEEVPADFHARKSVRKKTYFYRIMNRASRPALERKTCWFVSAELDIRPMKDACRLIRGEHDFRAFCSEADEKTTVREVFSAKIWRQGNYIIFSVEASGFLKRMVRMLAGTLVRVGRGRLTPDRFERILKTGKRTRDVAPAPPQGLFLEKVFY